MSAVIDLAERRRAQWRAAPVRNQMSRESVAAVLAVCWEHDLTVDQIADVFIDLEGKGYYA